ncbi:histone deacetylase 2 isoform X1 [Rutidosis leptorrhynchoides]|uniref:histone deacetylase 2 isoform X1 n=1 Tax=Rutidosis leptorrhynchoides TaxID=125765 RepID=UPI003A992605
MYLLHKKLYLHISPHSHHITTVSQPSPVPLHLLLLLRLYSPPASSTLHDSLTMSALPSTADPSSPSNSASKNTENDETIRRNRILSSKLYFDIPPSKAPIIYSPSYDISFLGIENLHPFDSQKWGRICQFLIADGVLDKTCIVEPLEATKEDLLVVHSESYLRSLKSSLTVSIITEVPPVAVFPNCLVQKKVLYPFRKQVGGTVLAAKLANERGYAINVGGGFHHCCADRGGGFCVYADISLCIHYAFIRLNISRVMIIDLDAHQGNGHETDFSDDRRVYILDMYNPYIYPLDYEARRYIDQRVEVPSGTTTEEYLVKLDEALQVAGNAFNPELVIYNAGTDILDGDPLGRLKVSPDGVSIRDEKVFRFARDKNIPLVMLTSGGYMKSSARVIADSIINLSNKSLITICGI